MARPEARNQSSWRVAVPWSFTMSREISFSKRGEGTPKARLSISSISRARISFHRLPFCIGVSISQAADLLAQLLKFAFGRHEPLGLGRRNNRTHWADGRDRIGLGSLLVGFVFLRSRKYRLHCDDRRRRCWRDAASLVRSDPGQAECFIHRRGSCQRRQDRHDRRWCQRDRGSPNKPACGACARALRGLQSCCR